MFSSTFYNKLDPKYREKLIQIEKTFIQFEEVVPFFKSPSSSIDTELTLQVLQDDIIDFQSRYMMPKELWDIMSNIYYCFPLNGMNLFESSEHHFQYQEPSSRKLYCTECHIIDPKDIKDFCYPHINMNRTFEKFERSRYSFVPKTILQNFERMKLQYDKIKSVEEDEEKWLESILEVDDEEFVQHNIEFRLGKDLTNKKLWKIYLEYLKSHDQQKLLQVYSKYCRFFLDDNEILEEYRIAAGKEKVRVPWKNAFDFEIYDEDFYHRQHEDENDAVVKKFSFKCHLKGENSSTRHEYMKRKFSQKVPLLCHFNGENAAYQRFPFRSNLMNYIIKNANACVLHDLFKSCKWFFFKNPVTICYKFEAGRSTHIQDQFISVSDFLSMSPLFKQIFISTNLSIDTLPSPVDLIPRIYRCTAKYVTLCDLTLTDEELRILIGHGNVVELSFDNVKNLNVESFKLEDIFEMVPKIKSIE